MRSMYLGFTKQKPLTKTALIVLFVIMAVATVLEATHIIGWREFFITQLNSTMLIGVINTYALMTILQNQSVKNTKDNHIRRGIYDRITALENRAVELETNAYTLEEQINELKTLIVSDNKTKKK